MNQESATALAYAECQHIPSMEQRLQFAESAYQLFAHIRHLTTSQWNGHGVLAAVSEAQCLVWLDPQEALCQLETLRGQAQKGYPALLDKIDRTKLFARQRLAKNRNVVRFDLDHR